MQPLQFAPLSCSIIIPLFCQQKHFMKLLMNQDRQMVWDNIFSPAWRKKSLYLAEKNVTQWEFFVSSCMFIFITALCSGRGQLPARSSSFLVGYCLCKPEEPKKHMQQHLLHTSTFHSNTDTLTLIHFTTGIQVSIEGE